MGHRCLSTNHSFPPPAWGCLHIVIQSHISHSCHPTIAFPQPRAIFTSSSKATCLQSCHLPIALSQPRAIFMLLSKPMCLQSHHPPITLSCLRLSSHHHWNPHVSGPTASQLLIRTSTLKSSQHHPVSTPVSASWLGAGCLHGGNYYRCIAHSDRTCSCPSI